MHFDSIKSKCIFTDAFMVSYSNKSILSFFVSVVTSLLVRKMATQRTDNSLDKKSLV